MARLSFGFMVLLLTCSKLASANVLPAPDEITEKPNLNGENNSTDTRTPTSLEKSYILETLVQNEDSNKFAKRSIDYARNNRLNNNNYNPSLSQSESVPHPYSFFPLLQPQSYQINRPYYIPVLHGPGGSAIIFPPQPINIDFAQLPNNGYLPPGPNYPPDNIPPCATTTTTSMPIIYRGPTGPDHTVYPTFTPPEDPRQIWGIIQGTPTRKPGLQSTTPPSLIHSVNDIAGDPIPTRSPGLRSTTPPSLIHNEKDVDSRNENESPNVTPVEKITVTAAPPRTIQPPRALPPSSCVWSIVACCSSTSSAVNSRCFEEQGCEGAFWDGSPCDAPLARAALQSIMKYYATQS